ncbi:uncharacterized protein MELLADRAFT_118607 [Melampsora larici-populina 98AG31]|uniref:Uncharacterized protein n=1 Tax=Melampsora larici-populina (strain 98AG31 / pathotype 3-4-7) TaxID=747676 RepID=F4SB73_MELLP|nr:uncharacterized protein MELLADRAFT_118607 [Melampsora larici-populina 98AG31]EGF98099.1 hypothetical protein MELLADRAFT_118607 [Melampsora larici-populina 98AG31]
MSEEHPYTHRNDNLDPNRFYSSAQLDYQDRLLNGDIATKYDAHRDDDRYSAPFDEALNSHSATFAEADPHQPGHDDTYGYKDHEIPHHAYPNLTTSHPASQPRRVERFESYDPTSDSAFLTQQLYQSSRNPLAAANTLAELESDRQPYHSQHPNLTSLAQFNRLAPHKVIHHQHHMESRPQGVSYPVSGLTEPLPIDQEVRGVGVTKHAPAVSISRLIELKRRAKALEELKNRSLHDRIPYPPQEPTWCLPETHHSSIPVPRGLSAPHLRDIIPPRHPPLGTYTVPHPRQPTEHFSQQPDYHSRTQPPLARPRTLSQPLLPPDISDPLLRLHHLKVTEIMSPVNGFDLFKCVSLYYGRLSEIYNKAGEIELRQILDRPLDAVLASDPFAQSIPIDYGYGAMKSLNDYGVAKEQLDCIDAICLDDLYLLEQVLRNDFSIIESERLRRWNRRMRWEELSIQQQQVQWDVMSSTDRRNLGLGSGGWWAYRLRMTPLDDTYGHHRTLVGTDGLFEEQHSGFKKGTFEAHYPLSTQTKVKFPFWRDGGLGLGRSLIKWLELPSTEEPTYEPTSPLSPSSAVVDNPSTQAVAVEPHNEVELQHRKEEQMISRMRAASRRRAQLIASIQAQTLLPPSAAELAFAASYPVVNHAHFEHRGHPHGYPGLAAYSPHHHYPVHHHPGQYHAPDRQPVHRNHSALRSKDVKPTSKPIPTSSSNNSASGLPWGVLLSELRKRPGWGDRHPSNPKPKSNQESKEDSTTKVKSDDPSKHANDPTKKSSDPKDPDLKKNDEKREAYKRMESSYSVTSQVPPPPAYQSNGSTRKSSLKGLPQPPLLYKAKEFPRSGSSRLVKERPPTTKDT